MEPADPWKEAGGSDSKRKSNASIWSADKFHHYQEQGYFQINVEGLKMKTGPSSLSLFLCHLNIFWSQCLGCVRVFFCFFFPPSLTSSLGRRVVRCTRWGRNNVTQSASSGDVSISTTLHEGTTTLLSKCPQHPSSHMAADRDSVQFSSVQLLSRVRLLWPHESQHARLPCPSPTPGVYSNSCPSSRWCHPAISSSVIPFSSCPQCFPASGSFPTS